MKLLHLLCREFLMPPIPRVQKLKDLPEITLMREIREAVLSDRDTLLGVFLADREEVEQKNKEISHPKALLDSILHHKYNDWLRRKYRNRRPCLRLCNR